MQIQYDLIASSYQKRNFQFLTRPYECNPFGIRTKEPVVNQFKDVLGIAYIDSLGVKQCLCFQGSTLPGLYYLKTKLGNADGTAILQPGQHLKSWILGYHHVGKPEQYQAFQQSADHVFKVWRDKNADGVFDFTGPTYTDVQGLNGHHAADKESVGAYSAGCQVVRDKEEHLIWIAPARRHVELYGNIFHYTLFEQQ